MTVESAAYISGLVPAYPPGSDSISEGDDHLRLLKTVLQGTFPNANAAINGIHTGTSAPSAKTAGTIWYDTTTSHKVLKIYDGSGWVTLVSSPATDFKLLGATNVGWVLPTADGSADQFLTTDGSGNLDWASAAGDELPSQTGHSGKFLTTNGSAASWSATTGQLLAVTHAKGVQSAYIREDAYTDAASDTGFTITHDKQSATSDLYVTVTAFLSYAPNYDSGDFIAYLQLFNSATTVITGTDLDIPLINSGDPDNEGATIDNSGYFVRIFKVTAANCPDGTTGNNEFTVRIRMTASSAADGGVYFGSGTMLVEEVG